MQKDQPHPRPRPAFTLVELLVVLSIIALLISILAPACTRAHAQAQRLKCLSNLRQLATAAFSYTNDNDGFFPIAYYTAFEGTTTYSYNWDFTTITQPHQPTQVIPGLLWNGAANVKVQQCPTYAGSSNTTSDPYTGYNYNTSYVGHGQDEAIPAPAKLNQIARPSETALFGDGQYSGGADKFMRAPYPSPGDATFDGRWAGTQGFRHLGQTNVAFCDGHAESLSTIYTATKDGAANVGAGTGFLSKDNFLYGLDLSLPMAGP